VHVCVREDRFPTALANVGAPLERRKHLVAIIARNNASLISQSSSTVERGLFRLRKRTDACVYLGLFRKGKIASVNTRSNISMAKNASVHMGKFGKRTNASVQTSSKFSMGTNASVFGRGKF
jgi:hypothetical protein